MALIFGRKGTGKTTVMKRWGQEALKAQKPVLVIDELNNFNLISLTVRENDSGKLLQAIKERRSFRITSGDRNFQTNAILLAFAAGNYVVACDEADKLFGRDMPIPLQRIFLRARNQGIDFILATLRPHRIAVDVRNQADVIICFSLVNKTALDALANEFGNAELSERVKGLTGHQYARYDVNKNVLTTFLNKNKKTA